VHPCPPLCTCVTPYPTHQALLKHLEARRRVVYVDEYNTSQFCPECDHRLVHHSNREKRCTTCRRVWNRDVVGALNQRKVFDAWVEKGERPEHLRRPEKDSGAPAGTPAQAAPAPAPPSKKRNATTAGLDGPTGVPSTPVGATPVAGQAGQGRGGGGPPGPARRRPKVGALGGRCGLGSGPFWGRSAAARGVGGPGRPRVQWCTPCCELVLPGPRLLPRRPGQDRPTHIRQPRNTPPPPPRPCAAKLTPADPPR
jgi:hypothetical protein